MPANENAPAIVWLSYNVHGNEAIFRSSDDDLVCISGSFKYKNKRMAKEYGCYH